MDGDRFLRLHVQMDLDSFVGRDVLSFHHPARIVRADRYRTQVERAVSFPDLFEYGDIVRVARVAGEVEFVVPIPDRIATPESFVRVAKATA